MMTSRSLTRCCASLLAVVALVAAACGDDGDDGTAGGTTTTQPTPVGPTVPAPLREGTFTGEDLCALIDTESAAALLDRHAGVSYDGAGASLEARPATTARTPVCRVSWSDGSGQRLFLDVNEPYGDGLEGPEAFDHFVELALLVDPTLVTELGDLGDEAVLIGPPLDADPLTASSFPNFAMAKVGGVALQTSGLFEQSPLLEPFLRLVVDRFVASAG